MEEEDTSLSPTTKEIALSEPVIVCRTWDPATNWEEMLGMLSGTIGVFTFDMVTCPYERTPTLLLKPSTSTDDDDDDESCRITDINIHKKKWNWILDGELRHQSPLMYYSHLWWILVLSMVSDNLTIPFDVFSGIAISHRIFHPIYCFQFFSGTISSPSIQHWLIFILVHFRGKHIIHMIYLSSTVRLFDIYYSTDETTISNEHLQTVQCLSNPTEALLPDDFYKYLFNENERHISQVTNSHENHRRSKSDVDRWLEVCGDSTSKVISGKNVHPLQVHAASVYITDLNPCSSITLYLRSLQNEVSVYINDILIAANPVSSQPTSPVSSTSSDGDNAARTALMSRFLPRLLQQNGNCNNIPAKNTDPDHPAVHSQHFSNQLPVAGNYHPSVPVAVRENSCEENVYTHFQNDYCNSIPAKNTDPDHPVVHSQPFSNQLPVAGNYHPSVPVAVRENCHEENVYTHFQNGNCNSIPAKNTDPDHPAVHSQYFSNQQPVSGNYHPSVPVAVRENSHEENVCTHFHSWGDKIDKYFLQVEEKVENLEALFRKLDEKVETMLHRLETKLDRLTPKSCCRETPRQSKVSTSEIPCSVEFCSPTPTSKPISLMTTSCPQDDNFNISCHSSLQSASKICAEIPEVLNKESKSPLIDDCSKCSDTSASIEEMIPPVVKSPLSIEYLLNSALQAFQISSRINEDKNGLQIKNEDKTSGSAVSSDAPSEGHGSFSHASFERNNTKIEHGLENGTCSEKNEGESKLHGCLGWNQLFENGIGGIEHGKCSADVNNNLDVSLSSGNITQLLSPEQVLASYEDRVGAKKFEDRVCDYDEYAHNSQVVKCYPTTPTNFPYEHTKYSMARNQLEEESGASHNENKTQRSLFANNPNNCQDTGLNIDSYPTWYSSDHTAVTGLNWESHPKIQGSNVDEFQGVYHCPTMPTNIPYDSSKYSKERNQLEEERRVSYDESKMWRSFTANNPNNFYNDISASNHLETGLNMDSYPPWYSSDHTAVTGLNWESHPKFQGSNVDEFQGVYHFPTMPTNFPYDSSNYSTAINQLEEEREASYDESKMWRSFTANNPNNFYNDISASNHLETGLNMDSYPPWYSSDHTAVTGLNMEPYTTWCSSAPAVITGLNNGIATCYGSVWANNGMAMQVSEPSFSGWYEYGAEYNALPACFTNHLQVDARESSLPMKTPTAAEPWKNSSDFTASSGLNNGIATCYSSAWANNGIEMQASETSFDTWRNCDIGFDFNFTDLGQTSGRSSIEAAQGYKYVADLNALSSVFTNHLQVDARESSLPMNSPAVSERRKGVEEAIMTPIISCSSDHTAFAGLNNEIAMQASEPSFDTWGNWDIGPDFNFTGLGKPSRRPSLEAEAQGSEYGADLNALPSAFMNYLPVDARESSLPMKSPPSAELGKGVEEVMAPFKPWNMWTSFCIYDPNQKQGITSEIPQLL